MRDEQPRAKYLNETFGLDDKELNSVRERMRTAERERIAVSSYEARILQFLIRGFGIRKVVEFGTLFGYSALAMAKALPEDGSLITLEKSPIHHAAAQETFKSFSAGRKVTALCGEAHELMKSITSKGPFDMVFIDADKPAYVDYLSWAEENLRSGGLIVGDNSFAWGGLWNQPEREDIDPGAITAMREFNLRLADSTRYNSILIPTGEGMTVAQKLAK